MGWSVNVAFPGLTCFVFHLLIVSPQLAYLSSKGSILTCKRVCTIINAYLEHMCSLFG